MKDAVIDNGQDFDDMGRELENYIRAKTSLDKYPCFSGSDMRGIFSASEQGSLDSYLSGHQKESYRNPEVIAAISSFFKEHRHETSL